MGASSVSHGALSVVLDWQGDWLSWSVVSRLGLAGRLALMECCQSSWTGKFADIVDICIFSLSINALIELSLSIGALIDVE